MIQDIIKAAKEAAKRAWATLTVTAGPKRPQLDGRRGYGEGDVKPPE